MKLASPGKRQFPSSPSHCEAESPLTGPPGNEENLPTNTMRTGLEEFHPKEPQNAKHPQALVFLWEVEEGAFADRSRAQLEASQKMPCWDGWLRQPL